MSVSWTARSTRFGGRSTAEERSAGETRIARWDWTSLACPRSAVSVAHSDAPLIGERAATRAPRNAAMSAPM